MIVLLNPRATRPRNCRLPLSVMALAAVLEGREEYAIVDGNIERDPTAQILQLIDQHNVEMLGVTCMPGPQMAAAMETSREVRRLRPEVPIVWGGYFPSTYPDCCSECGVRRLCGPRTRRRYALRVTGCATRLA